MSSVHTPTVAIIGAGYVLYFSVAPGDSNIDHLMGSLGWPEYPLP